MNPHLGRGLDYYPRTVFETFVEGPPAKKEKDAGTGGEGTTESGAGAVVEAPGRKLAVVSGGRYDGLVELVGGGRTPAVGGALGLERFLALVRERGAKVPQPERPKLFLVQLGDLARKKSFRLMEEIRRAGVSMAESLGRDSIRSQLKIADRLGVAYALIVGQKEALDGTVILREMTSGIQETIPQAKLIETMKRRLKK